MPWKHIDVWHFIQMEVGARGVGRVSPWYSLERWGGIRGEEEEVRNVPHQMSDVDVDFQGVLRDWGSWSSGFKHCRSLECHNRESRLYLEQCGAIEGFYTYCIYGSYDVSFLLKLNILIFLCFGLICIPYPSHLPQYSLSVIFR